MNIVEHLLAKDPDISLRSLEEAKRQRLDQQWPDERLRMNDNLAL